MNIALSITYHDPQGGLIPQIERNLPTLQQMFRAIAVRGSRQANDEALSLFESLGAVVEVDSSPDYNLGPQIGRARREAVALALEFDMPFSMHCDGDRILHWVENYPSELADIISWIPGHDFTVLGRTTRAFTSHPRMQRDTEAIVNHLFHINTGYAWDVMIGARGLSKRAAQAIVDQSQDNEISVDVTWPLLIRSLDGFSLAYFPTEGLEFETHDRFGDELEAAGSLEAWMSNLDSDIHKWLYRLEYVRLDLEAMLPFLR
ncbi:MAG: hypothetical protein ACK2U1_17785 [Anaerolineales bacterium]|jgi:hypothetical protein